MHDFALTLGHEYVLGTDFFPGVPLFLSSGVGLIAKARRIGIPSHGGHGTDTENAESRG